MASSYKEKSIGKGVFRTRDDNHWWYRGQFDLEGKLLGPFKTRKEARAAASQYGGATKVTKAA